MSSSPQRVHLPALDGLRAIAVLIVILYHAGVVRGVPGDLGVTFFFVLSGFLITWLLIAEHARTGTVSLRAFYRRRTFRIFPAYYAFVLLSLVADTVRGHRWSGGLIVAAVSYTVNYYNAALGHPTTSVAHAWSLAVEEQFYLLWPLAFLALWRWGRTRAVPILLGVIGAVLAWRVVLWTGLHASPAYLYNAFDCRADALAIGCLVAVVRADAPRGLSAVRHALTRWTWLPLITLALIWLSRTQTPAAYHYTLGMTMEAGLMAVVLAQLLTLHAAPLWRWLEQPRVRWLGAISYPCYLWHGWGLAIGDHLVTAPWPAFLVGYLATIGIAAISYYGLERPVLALRDRPLGWPLRWPLRRAPLRAQEGLDGLPLGGG